MKLKMQIVAAIILMIAFTPAVNADLIFDPHDLEASRKKLEDLKKNAAKDLKKNTEQDTAVSSDEKTEKEKAATDVTKAKESNSTDLKRSKVKVKKQSAVHDNAQIKQINGGSAAGKKSVSPIPELNSAWYDPNFIAIALMTGYALGVILETPVLVAFLSACHSFKTRLKAGFLLTACTYPFVIILMPRLINPDLHNTLYLAVTETLVPIAECAIFWLVFHRPMQANLDGTATISRDIVVRDFAVIVAANLFSFGVGELISFYLTKM